MSKKHGTDIEGVNSVAFINRYTKSQSKSRAARKARRANRKKK